jgi:hypothetical protein
LFFKLANYLFSQNDKIHHHWHSLCLIKRKNIMGNFKAFLLGLFTAYGIYFVTRKGPDGKSTLDELIANPADFMHKAKDYAVQDTVKIIREELS